MKKILFAVLVIALLLALIPAIAFAATKIKGSFPVRCGVWVPPYYNYDDTVFYIYYPEKDEAVAKCTAEFANPPDEVISYT